MDTLNEQELEEDYTGLGVKKIKPYLDLKPQGNQGESQEQSTDPSTENVEQSQEEIKEEKPKEEEEKKGGWDTPVNYVKATALGALDFPIDVITKITGQEHLDESYDKITKFENPTTQKLREAISIILPNLFAAKYLGGRINASSLVGLNKALANIGGNALLSGSIMGISDYSENADNFARTLVDTFPDTYGPDGTNPIPKDWVTQDGDSIQIRRKKNILDETVLSGVADILGYVLNAGKPALHWFKPLNGKAKKFKKNLLIKNADDETKKTVSSMDDAIEDPWLSTDDKNKIIKGKNTIIKQVEETGTSEAATNQAEAYVRQQQKSRQLELDLDGEAALKLNPTDTTFNPDITPSVANEASTTRQAIPPANLQRNAADIALKAKGEVGTAAPLIPNIKKGWRKFTQQVNKTPKGDVGIKVPDPLRQETMLRKGFELEDPWLRESVSEMTKEMGEAGNYYVLLHGHKLGQRSMSTAAWKYYRDIMDPTKTIDEVKNLFVDGKELRKLYSETGKEVDVPVFSEQQTLAAGFALRDLVNIYLGREVNEQSARVMATFGDEISDFAKATQQFPGLVDDKKVLDDVLDRMGFLTQEYGLNKYLSGWSLRNKGWFNRLTKKNADEFAGLTAEQFKEVRKQKGKRWDEFRNNLTELTKENPAMRNTLMEAFVYSDGDVDTLEKLYKFAEDQISAWGMIKSPDPRQMNLFARGMWSVIYNNTLSGLSGLRAAVGNGTMMILKPISSLLSHGAESVLKRDFEPLERALYYHSNVFETTRRAIEDGIKRMKLVHNDADFMNKVIREDFVVKNDRLWSSLDGMEEHWKKTDNWGALYQYNWAKWNWNISKMKWFRTGTTFMSGVDGMTDTYMATIQSRVRAYDDVIKERGRDLDPKEFWKLVKKAEERNYKRMFDNQNVLTDVAAKNASGEVALNLDDSISNGINNVTTAYPFVKNFFMFPRTGVNMAKLAMSYTPLAAIPGLSKYGKILNAGNDLDKILDALKDHGIKSLDDTPNALAIYKNLKREYQGRLMMSSGISILAYNYALAGKIRGNGPVNNADRQKLRAMGWRNKTIEIGGKWFSYDGIPMLDTVLTTLADAAFYHNDLGSSMTQDLIDKVTWTLSATYLNNTPLYGLEPLTAAFSGDESQWKRITANMVRGAIPMSGALGVVSNAITSAQKDIYDDLWGYIGNRVPIFSSTLPIQKDFWTGRDINEIDNPLLRALNAASPIKVSQGNEPWRIWLINSGFDGVGMFRTSRDGYEYTADEREALGEIIGQMQLWKKVDALSKKDWANKQIEEVRQFRKGNDYDKVKQYKDNLRVYQELNSIVNDAKKRAEYELANNDKYKHIWYEVRANKLIKSQLKNNQVEAAKSTNKELKELQRLLKKQRK
tara:strand:- start:81 stop:4220 length:4140 start_codon:yes stop_codon:yes gene_type:complete